MTTIYEAGRWTVTEGNITVTGPTREGCEERVLELAERFRLIHELKQEEKNNEQR
jgi:hypothetical protein